MSQFLAIFIDEGREQIELLENSFLEIEKAGQGSELVQDLFRAAHTLKGSSKAMGFSAMGDLTHRMEDVLDVVREGRLPISSELVSVMLACADFLNGLMDRIAAVGTDEVLDPALLQTLLDQLGDLLGAPATAVASPQTPSDPAQSVEATPVKHAKKSAKSKSVEGAAAELAVFLTLEPECEFRGARALMALMAAEESGKILSTLPSRQEIIEESFGYSFQVTIETTKNAQWVLDRLKGVPEIANVQLVHESEEPKTEAAPAAVSPRAAQAQAATSPVATSQTIRVDVNRLDILLNLVGELVTDRTQMANLSVLLRARHQGDELVAQVLEATTRIARVTGELQDEIMKTRMLPIDNAFQRMPRVVRDLAQKLGKKIKLDISGGDTEIDRSLIDALSDPLIHLLRNCVDHGVEDLAGRSEAGKPAEGTVKMAARHEENNIVIEISDDGKGIDPVKVKKKAVESGLLTDIAAAALTDADALKLIFAPGLSTAKEVSDVSGRGVGMDIVKTNIEKIGGRILLESKFGHGTKFTIRLPLTLAIMRALLVESDGTTYALPLCSVVETLRLGISEGSVKREKLSGKCAMVLRGETVPLSNLEGVLTRAKVTSSSEKIPSDACVVVVGAGNGQIGLCVDSLKGEQEIVIKPLGALLGDVHGISGASILGDGSVALIVDPTKAMVQAA